MLRGKVRNIAKNDCGSTWRILYNEPLMDVDLCFLATYPLWGTIWGDNDRWAATFFPSVKSSPYLSTPSQPRPAWWQYSRDSTWLRMKSYPPPKMISGNVTLFPGMRRGITNLNATWSYALIKRVAFSEGGYYRFKSLLMVHCVQGTSPGFAKYSALL